MDLDFYTERATYPERAAHVEKSLPKAGDAKHNRIIL